uniref:Solute carrier family 25 member 47a n=1 Tax=Nothobranchius furzeri TaxID=105023 RepID=A0A8C6LYM1_NOTFU
TSIKVARLRVANDHSHKFLSCVLPMYVHGFFKGMSLPMATVSLTSSVVFGTYRNCLQCMKQARGADWAPNTKLEVFLAGMAGGVAQVKETESMRKGTNAPRPKYHGPLHCLLSIIRGEGVTGLYRGALPLTLRDGPSYATYFLTYTTIYEWLSGGSMKSLAGGIAGIAGWTVGTPMDVIKARLQVDGVREMKQTVRVEGAGVFFKSLGVNCLRAFPVNMVVFVTYEVLSGSHRTGPERVEPPPLGEPSHSAKKTHFGHLYPQSRSFGHYPKLMTIGEGRN